MVSHKIIINSFKIISKRILWIKGPLDALNIISGAFTSILYIKIVNLCLILGIQLV